MLQRHRAVLNSVETQSSLVSESTYDLQMQLLNITLYSVFVRIEGPDQRSYQQSYAS